MVIGDGVQKNWNLGDNIYGWPLSLCCSVPFIFMNSRQKENKSAVRPCLFIRQTLSSKSNCSWVLTKNVFAFLEVVLTYIPDEVE